MTFRKTVLLPLVLSTGLASPAFADVSIGLLGGITGGTAALAPEIMRAYELAVSDVNDNGGLLEGQKLIGVQADDGCNPQAGADAATKVVNVSGVVGVVGPWCSGAVLAAANSVTIPAGVPLITPAGTSPAITELNDNDLVFRTIPSDEYQGQVLARTLLARGTDTVAVSFINNDYGNGLAEAFRTEYEAKGGTIAGYAAHEENRATYRTDLAQLASEGADTLVLFDYGDTSGLTVLREALENGFFENFVGGEGMKSSAPIEALGAENLSTFLVSSPVGEASQGLDAFNAHFAESGGDPNAVFANTGYDAVFVLALAIEKAGGDRAGIVPAMREVTAGQGEPILPGEWEKAKAAIEAGNPIHYVGASGSLAFDEKGDVPGSYALFEISGEDYAQIAVME